MSRSVVAVDQAVRRRIARGEQARMDHTILGAGDGWSVADVICTSGPADRAFAEQHAGISVGVVLAGTFQYRTGHRAEMLTPGSVLLGNDGQCYQCDHEHASGDRCVAFRFSPEYFEPIVAGAGGPAGRFAIGRLPPVRALARISAAVETGLDAPGEVDWGEVGLVLADTVIRLAHDVADRAVPAPPRAVVARVTESLRAIERNPSAHLTLETLAREAGVSAYHYLRTFRRVTGVTPHQFLIRTRLRLAAARLVAEPGRIAEVAFGVGFGDLSTFNHAFRAEYGVSPRAHRLGHWSGGAA